MNMEEGQTPEFDSLWDQAIAQLDEHNEKLFEKCSVPVKNFVKNNVLFNCPVFCVGDSSAEYNFVVGSADAKEIYFLGYELVDDIKIKNHVGPAFDDGQSPLWLYDEIHLVENHYEHHIVLSDGREFIIPFIFFQCRKTNWFEG